MAENVTTGLRSGRFWQVQGVEEVKLLRCRGGRSFESPLCDAGLVPVDSRQQVEGGTGGGGVSLDLQAHAHDAVEDQCQEADQCVGADPVGQAVVDRGDLAVGFQISLSDFSTRKPRSMSARDF
jgi:hypothetical protein